MSRGSWIRISSLHRFQRGAVSWRVSWSVSFLGQSINLERIWILLPKFNISRAVTMNLPCSGPSTTLSPVASLVPLIPLTPLESFPIDFGSIIESLENPETRPKLETRFTQWADSHGCSLATFKSIFFHSIRHISFDEFMQHLKASAEAFHTHYFPRKYTMVITTSAAFPESTKSNAWIARLLLSRTCLSDYRPSDVIFGDLDSPLKLPSRDLCDLYVVPDDAVFGGSQMKAVVQNLFESKMPEVPKVPEIEVAVIVAATTRLGLDRINLVGRQISVFYADVLQSMQQTARLLASYGLVNGLDDEAIDYMKDSQCAVYFDHKIPDFESVPTDLISNFARGCLFGNFSDLTKKHQQMATFEVESTQSWMCPVPPYKLEKWTGTL